MTSLAVALLAFILGFVTWLIRQTLRKRDLYANAYAFAPGAQPVKTAKTKRRLKRTLPKRLQTQIDSELPDLVALMAVVLQSGSSIQHAIEVVVETGTGHFAKQLQLMKSRLQLGSTFDAELNKLCVELPTSGVREFASKLAIAINRGTPLAESLAALSITLRRRAGNQILRDAGANETKMLIPLVTVVLPVTVIFALFPSAQILQLSM